MDKNLISNSLSIVGGGVDLFLGTFNLPPVASITITGATTIFDALKNAKEKSFYEKVENFLRETHSTTDQERIGFLQRLDEDRVKFQERILLLLDKLDDEQKATIIGRLCKAFILLHINKDDFFRLTLIIENIYFDDLDFFYTRYKSTITEPVAGRRQELVEFEVHDQSKPMISNLVNAGLLERQETMLLQHTSSNSVVGHKPAIVGKALLQYGLQG